MARPLQLLFVCLSLLRALSAKDFDSWRVGSAVDTHVAANIVAPGLLLSGGRGDVDDAFRWFASRCGGGDVLVLRTSGDDGYQEYLYKKIGGFASVTTFALREPKAASSPHVLAAVSAAEGIFLAGGDQARYIREWVGTPLQKALQAHVDAGRPIGGTSAGLAVLGQHSFHALHDTITSAEVLSDPNDVRVTLGSGLVLHPMMRGILTDSHFSARDRLGRLAVFLGLLQRQGVQDVIGLGVDEGTAVCVDGISGVGKVMSVRGGCAWVVRFTVENEFRGGGVASPIRVGETVVFPELHVGHAERISFRIEGGSLLTD
ncbi:MAG: cyanophycinase [Opitutaceae bacterium]|nr:cyanophycinase [Opitutaceae bacterium]